MAAHNYAHITAIATYPLANYPTLLSSVNLNNSGASSVITLTDDTGSGSGPVIAVIKASASPTWFKYDVQTLYGLTATISGGACDATVAFG